MLQRHLSGRHFEKDDQATLACPIRGPVLENGGVHGDPVNRRFFWRAVAMHESAIPNGAHCTSFAAHLSEVFIRCPKSESPHCSVGWDRRYNGCTQSLIVRSR